MAESKFIGRPKELYRDRDGKRWIVSFSTDSRINGDVFDELAKVDCDIEVRKHREKRSLSANAYFHALVNKIAAETRESDEAVKVRLVTEYGVVDRMEDGMVLGIKIPSSVPPERIYKYTRFIESRCENGKMFNCYLVLKRTSEMNSKEMAHLIDMTIEEARELGIETETPRELEEMKRRWAEYEAAHPRKGEI